MRRASIRSVTAIKSEPTRFMIGSADVGWYPGGTSPGARSRRRGCRSTLSFAASTETTSDPVGLLSALLRELQTRRTSGEKNLSGGRPRRSANENRARSGARQYCACGQTPR